MRRRKLWRKGGVLAFAVVLCTAFSVVDVLPQDARNPHSKDDIVGLLKGQVAPRRVAVVARQPGIDFQITTGVEDELRRAGAVKVSDGTPGPTLPHFGAGIGSS
jgi:hypothetical protein